MSDRLLVGRLAPSPTGAQHVGNARTYLLAWLSIRSRGGRLIFRMEDIDSPRIKPWAVQQAIDDLRWLGLDWDEGPDIGGPNGPYVQTERLERYRQVLGQLQSADRVYPCTCSRSDVQAAASAPHLEGEGPSYPGTCAIRRPADADTLTGRPFCWRLRAGRAGHGFEDRVAGWQKPADVIDDFVVWKASTTPAYQLAVVIDDSAMGVTEVLRGDDLIPSTFRQLELFELLGWQPPVFAHVPLVIGPDGRRLAKRHGDTRLSSLREAGVSPEALIGLLAWSSGLQPEPTPITARELLGGFDLARIPRQPFVLTDDLLRQIGYEPRRS